LIPFPEKYNKNMMNRREASSNRKRERDVGAAGRPFNLKVKERFFLMLLFYYRLYIMYTSIASYKLISSQTLLTPF
jgi:hypothetical protein